MNQLFPGTSVNMNVRNPGQFFACCGLLELADRLWPKEGVEGWFDDSQFRLVAPGAERPLEDIMNVLRETEMTSDDTRGENATRPVRIMALGITLDWWIDASGKKTDLKLWAGNQSSMEIIGEKLQRNLPKRAGNDLFEITEPLRGRLGVDPRSAWNALDVGFSPHKQDMVVVTFPAVELLAAIGLQGFRPGEDKEAGGFRYATWDIPLPVSVSRAASAGLLPINRTEYRFPITKRGQYKGFDYATEVRGEKYERETNQRE